MKGQGLIILSQDVKFIEKMKFLMEVMELVVNVHGIINREVK